MHNCLYYSCFCHTGLQVFIKVHSAYCESQALIKNTPLTCLNHCNLCSLTNQILGVSKKLCTHDIEPFTCVSILCLKYSLGIRQKLPLLAANIRPKSGSKYDGFFFSVAVNVLCSRFLVKIFVN